MGADLHETYDKVVHAAHKSIRFKWTRRGVARNGAWLQARLKPERHAAKAA